VLGLTGDPTTNRSLPDISDLKAQLGMKLFFTKRLGLDQDTACVSCHHPSLGGADDLSLSIGVDAENEKLLGPGRLHLAGSPGDDGLGIITPDTVDKLTADPDAGDNLPTAQSLFPVTSPEQMRGFDFLTLVTNNDGRTELETRLAENPEWVAEFNAVYGDQTQITTA
jgi:cytochrome c peroxidase